MCAWKQAVNKSNREELRERRKKEKVCEGGLKRTTGRQWKEGRKKGRRRLKMITNEEGPSREQLSEDAR